MIEYARNFKNIQKAETNVRDVLIAFNNHFAGFGPQSVNDFLKDHEQIGEILEERTRKSTTKQLKSSAW